ncbi:MAG TPA: cytochrome c maturation protein CcmE [Edaphocola sp.]|nr:cytochrome c maturation protein CcmE [Edaphocola sp.]
MKKSSIIILLGIAVLMGLAVSMFGKLSTYETFGSAAEKQGKTFVVMGTLDTTVSTHYDPKVNTDEFIFNAMDKTGKSNKVVFNGTRPQDFERSESLVMTGFMKGDVFHCEKIQMKCPSKYEDDQVVISNPSAVN